jgi:hypothetical protein
VQVAVDAKHHLIVAHEITTSGTTERRWHLWRKRRARQ